MENPALDRDLVNSFRLAVKGVSLCKVLSLAPDTEQDTHKQAIIRIENITFLDMGESSHRLHRYFLPYIVPLLRFFKTASLIIVNCQKTT